MSIEAASKQPDSSMAQQHSVGSVGGSGAAHPLLWYPYIEGIRFFLAFFIILHHTFYDFPRFFAVSHLLNFFIQNWRYPIVAFFFLSGYCLMIPVLRADYHLSPSVWGFYKKRALRLLLPYYAGLALSLFFILFFIGRPTGFHWDLSLSMTWRNVLSALVLLQNPSRAFPINYSYWFIAVNFQLSVLFPLILVLWRRLGDVATAATLLVLPFILRALHLLYMDPGVNFEAFIVGMLAASIALSPKTSLQQLRTRVPWTVGCIIFGAIVLLQACDFNDMLHLGIFLGMSRNGWLLLFLLCFFIALAQGTLGHVQWFFSWSPLVFLGQFSYSIYLVHAPLVQIFQQYVMSSIHVNEWGAVMLAFFVLLPVIIAVAWLFFVFVEGPALRVRFVSRSSGDRV